MGKAKELSIQKTQMIICHHKSGNVYKKIQQLHIPLSTVRANKKGKKDLEWSAKAISVSRLKSHEKPVVWTEGGAYPKDNNDSEEILNEGMVKKSQEMFFISSLLTSGGGA